MITKADVKQAIVDVYDVHVSLYGYDRNVFSIATRSQVAAYLNVSPYYVSLAIGKDAMFGFARFKQQVLEEAGRGSRTGSSCLDVFIPREGDIA